MSKNKYTKGEIGALILFWIMCVVFVLVCVWAVSGEERSVVPVITEDGFTFTDPDGKFVMPDVVCTDGTRGYYFEDKLILLELNSSCVDGQP